MYYNTLKRLVILLTFIQMAFAQDVTDPLKGRTKCILEEDCIGLDISIVQSQYGHKPAEEHKIWKKTNEYGEFDFEGVPLNQNLTFNIFVQVKHFCWHRTMESITFNANDTNYRQIEFVQRGYDVKYRSFQ